MKVGITCGTFDLLHAGHVLFLKDCRDNCDSLIVCLQGDPTIDRDWKNKPIQSIEERKIQLEGCRYVDNIVVYDTEKELFELFSRLNWDIRFLGEDYKDKHSHEITGFYLGIIKYFSRDHGWSTTELRGRIKNVIEPR